MALRGEEQRSVRFISGARLGAPLGAGAAVLALGLAAMLAAPGAPGAALQPLGAALALALAVTGAALFSASRAARGPDLRLLRGGG